MFGCRTAIGVSCYALAFGLAIACGGSVAHNDAAGGSRGSSAGRSTAGASASAGNLGRGGSGASAGSDSTLDAGLEDPAPVETGCTSAELPPPELACDPFATGQCGEGVGCYPFVDHPDGTGCDQQRYGTVCLPAGHGTQGQLCGEDSSDWCASGFVCVVGQRAGKRCAKLCKLGSANTCSGGLICGDLDVAGFGVCG